MQAQLHAKTIASSNATNEHALCYIIIGKLNSCAYMFDAHLFVVCLYLPQSHLSLVVSVSYLKQNPLSCCASDSLY